MVKLYEGQGYNELLNEKDLVIVQFFATWCQPCKMLSPIVDAVADSNTDVAFHKVDIDDYRDLAVESGIRGVPTLILYKNGSEVSRQSGYQQKAAIESWINSFK